MNKAVIGLGSNLNPEDNITLARLTISRHFKVLKESNFVKTAPVNHPLRHEFINGCVYIETSLDFESLRQSLKKLEEELGRDRDLPSASPHPIDFDIVVWNGTISDHEAIKISAIRSAVLQILPGLQVS